MKRIWLERWDFLIAVVIAATGAYFLPDNAVKNVTTELITFFGIQSAVILPAMIFTAGILKPDGLELKEAERYHKALKRQMIFWVVLLALDFVAVVMLIAGKALGWSLVLTIPRVVSPISLGWVLPFLLYFCGSLAILRTIPFVRGVLSLLDMNSDMTIKAIRRRNKAELSKQAQKAAESPMQLPANYGKVQSPEE